MLQEVAEGEMKVRLDESQDRVDQSVAVVAMKKGASSPSALNRFHMLFKMSFVAMACLRMIRISGNLIPIFSDAYSANASVGTGFVLMFVPHPLVATQVDDDLTEVPAMK